MDSGSGNMGESMIDFSEADADLPRMEPSETPTPASKKEKDELANKLFQNAVNSVDAKKSAAEARKTHKFNTSEALKHVMELELHHKNTRYPENPIPNPNRKPK